MSSRIKVAGVGVETCHWIGGEPVAAGPDTFTVFSPIDGTVLGEVSAGRAGDVDQAVRAARHAFPGWASIGPIARGRILDRFAQGILERREELAAVETADNGSLLAGNLKRVVDRAAHNIRFFSEFACGLAAHAPLRGHVVDNHVHHEPAGVAALIAPWNAPLMLTTWKIGPALAAGNTVVVKPPEWAPFSCSLLAEIGARAGVPRGVLNVVQGAGQDAGQALVEHPGVDRISFTGSTATGRVVAGIAASRVVPVSLELGGKSPLLVFDDADLDDAAATVASQFNNAGQVCLAGTRVLVASSVEARFRALVLRAAGELVVGDPRQRGVRIGPLIHPRQLDRVSGLVRRALDGGARALLGGAPHERGGLYYQPTILAGVRQDDEIVQTEVFGPVLTWQTFDSEEEAIELANGTDYGLAAVVYTRDPARAERVTRRMVAGTVWVNCYFVRDLEAPFGGARRSGIGREGGAWSFDFFCDVKNVATKRGSFEGEDAHG
jgi:aminomuconate-semialdehyde/2-hydroxymuconate-6-semialdehyde dehydrogenase